MQEITSDDLSELLSSFKHSAVHLETRDAYGTETELPYMAKWAHGEPDDLAWLNEWCQELQDHVRAGRSVRRARVVSEPLSDYQRWSYSIAQPMVDAGEDIRWVPRRLTSTICLPGNDYYLIDDQQVVFLHYAGSGLNVAFTTTTNPAVVEMCRGAFEAVWALAIQHREYQPV
ncbi:DUF6879 family protein [Kribbella sp. NPDC003505]|uniref:DUF6879 family protein n=1 Tax=Kribbella sp. NPDC003505 TaxID=3154448 RepID=UPI0033A9C954